MAKKSEYKCVLYEKGDKLVSKFNNLFDEKLILEVEDTELKYVGIYPTLFIKFVGKPKDISDLSNYYVPAGETIEKYKDGLKYFNEAKVKAKSEKSSKTEITFTRRFNPKTDSLTAEDLKPRIMPKGFLNGRPQTTKEN